MHINLCFGCMEETASMPCPHCGYLHQNSAEQMFALQPGTILYGRYLVGRVLGQGGFGITYIGYDLPLARKVAIKEYFPASCVFRDSERSVALQWTPREEAKIAQKAGKDLFLKEARKMNQVDSIEQVVHILEVFEDNNTAYIVMDYAPGENLAQRVNGSGPVSWQFVQNILLPVADVMQEVHMLGLIHRDLSPDNLIIQPDGIIKILDLGAAKDQHLHNGVSSMQVAKHGFSPIEQYFQTNHTGAWTDVYSLAATIYFALTGIVPPSAIDRTGGAALRWNLPQFQQVPRPAIRALQKAMALREKDRYQSMKAFATEMRRHGRKDKTAKILAGTAAALLLVSGLLAARLFTPPKADNEKSGSDVTVQEGRPQGTGTPQASQTEQGAGEPWYDNVLTSTVIPEQYQYYPEQAPVFNSPIARYQIVSVTFLDSLATVGSNSWDVSHNKDGSVQAWTEPHDTVSIWMDGQTVTSDAYDLFIAAEGGINGKYCANLFSGFRNATQIDFNDCFHTDYTKSMEAMFFGCSKLDHLDISGLNTEKVRDMSQMFSNCGTAKLDLRSFDTSNVETMDSMFYSCTKLKSLDLQNFNTSKVTNMNHMFCLTTALVYLDISSFDTSSVTIMDFMFSLIGLTELDLTHFDTSKVTSMSYMFANNETLKTLNVTGWDTSKVTRMNGTFSDCDNLTTIQGITGWDTSLVESYDKFMDEGSTINGKPWEDMFR